MQAVELHSRQPVPHYKQLVPERYVFVGHVTQFFPSMY